jgi:hypothetical protein
VSGERNRIPDDAFEHYVGLGEQRSYRAVAEWCGVSERAVAARAGEEDWQGRLRRVQEQARTEGDAASARALRDAQTRHLEAVAELRAATMEIVTPPRMKAMVATLFQSVVQDKNVAAARVLFDRIFGKARAEALVGGSLALAGDLHSPSDVLSSVNAILQAVAEGRLSPEDAQKAAGIVEAGRKAIETEELGKRLDAIEKALEKKKR